MKRFLQFRSDQLEAERRSLTEERRRNAEQQALLDGYIRVIQEEEARKTTERAQRRADERESRRLQREHAPASRSTDAEAIEKELFAME